MLQQLGHRKYAYGGKVRNTQQDMGGQSRAELVTTLYLLQTLSPTPLIVLGPMLVHYVTLGHGKGYGWYRGLRTRSDWWTGTLRMLVNFFFAFINADVVTCRTLEKDMVCIRTTVQQDRAVLFLIFVDYHLVTICVVYTVEAAEQGMLHRVTFMSKHCGLQQRRGSLGYTI